MERLGRRYKAACTDHGAERSPPPGCVFLPVEITSDERVCKSLEVNRALSPLYEEITVRGTQRS